MFKGTCIVPIFLFNFILLQLKESDQSGHETPTVKVKISGDGAHGGVPLKFLVCLFIFSTGLRSTSALKGRYVFHFTYYFGNLGTSEDERKNAVNNTTTIWSIKPLFHFLINHFHFLTVAFLGNHTIVVIKPSNIDNLGIGLTNVRQTVKELMSAGFMEINGR